MCQCAFALQRRNVALKSNISLKTAPQNFFVRILWRSNEIVMVIKTKIIVFAIRFETLGKFILFPFTNVQWIVLYIVQLSKCTQKNIFFWNIFSDFFLFRMRPNFSFFRIAWYVVVFKKMKMNQEGRVKTKKNTWHENWQELETYTTKNLYMCYVILISTLLIIVRYPYNM